MEDLSRIARRITFTLFAIQSLASAGLIVTGTLTAIVGAQLSGNPALAGIPSAVNLFSAALGALAWGFIMGRAGWRPGLVFGLVLGVLGAIVASSAILGRLFFVFLGAASLLGIAQAAVQLGRFAAAEVHSWEGRGRAIANVVLGGTIGAILGPLLIGPAGRFALSAGVDELVGPYLVAMVLFILASLVVYIWLRPDPVEIAPLIELNSDKAGEDLKVRRSLRAIYQQPAAVVSTAAMVLGQVVMIIVMVITGLHMKVHGHSLTDIALVFSAHTFGMFAFSVVSGRLADRFGRAPVIMIGSVILVIACLASGLSPEVMPLAVSLFLLGLGWNFCYVGGSTLLTDQLSVSERARTQGFNDLLIGLVSAFGSLISGFIFASLGYQIMGILGACLALAPFAMTLRWWLGQRRVNMVSSGGIVK